MTKKVFKIIGIILLFLGPTIWGTIYTVKYYNMKNNSFENMFNNSIVEKMLYYYTLCREYEYNKNYDLDFYTKLILHCTQTVNLFDFVESMIEKNRNWNWYFGDSMNESWHVMKDYFDAIGWGIKDFPQGSIFDWIDNDITQKEDMYIYNSTYGDFIQSPIETLYRKKGDCEDFTILGASIFVSCGYETMIATINDKNVNMTSQNKFYDIFNHAFFFVKQNYTGVHSITNYWSFKNSNDTWLLVDIIWCHSLGDAAEWLSGYVDRTSRYFEDWSDIIDIKITDNYE